MHDDAPLAKVVAPGHFLIENHLLKELENIAETESKTVPTIVEEALWEFVQRKNHGAPRSHILSSFHKSMAKYDSLYKRLAK